MQNKLRVHSIIRIAFPSNSDLYSVCSRWVNYDFEAMIKVIYILCFLDDAVAVLINFYGALE